MDNGYILTILITSSILFSSFGQLCQKKAAKSNISNNPITNLAKNPFLFLSFVLLGFGLLAWLGVLYLMDVSIAYPLLALNFVFVLILSRWILGEKIPLQRWMGSVIIVAGIVVLLSENQ